MIAAKLRFLFAFEMDDWERVSDRRSPDLERLTSCVK